MSVQVLMLDASPALSAQDAADQHLHALPMHYAAMLSAGWHELGNAFFWPLPDSEADDVVTPWLVRKVRPAGAPPLETEVRGESRDEVWYLFGQRILGHRWSSMPFDPEEAWAWQSGANYSWLWGLAVAMCEEYRLRTGSRHPAAPILWALEQRPWAIEDDEEFTEPPLTKYVPDSARVVEGGFYDCVPSLRAWYTEQAGTLTWGNRSAPAWL